MEAVSSIRNSRKLIAVMRGTHIKRPLGKPRRTWEDNIRMDPREIWWEGVDWMHLAQDRDQCLNTVMIPRVL
jgi:hypothetical protein